MPSKKQAAARAAAANKSNNNKSAPTTKQDTPANKPRILDDLTRKDQPVTLPLTGKPSADLASWAASVADVAKSNKDWLEFNTLVDATLDKADEVARSPLDWYFILEDIYTNKETNVCLLDELPEPDSDKGNNPAKRKQPGQKANGELGSIEIDFYKELAKDLRPDLFGDVESLKNCGPNGNAAKIAEKHKHLLTQPANVLSLLERGKKRWARFQTTIKDAIWIRIQWARVEAMGKVVLDYVYNVEYDKDENIVGKSVVEGANVFHLSEKGNATNFKVLSVSNFLKLDVEKARKLPKGGTLSELLSTLTRGTTDGTPVVVAPMTKSRLEQTMAELAAYFNPETDTGQKNTAALSHDAINNQISEDYIRSLGHIIYALDPIEKIIRNAYHALVVADKQKALADAAMKQQDAK